MTGHSPQYLLINLNVYFHQKLQTRIGTILEKKPKTKTKQNKA